MNNQDRQKLQAIINELNSLAVKAEQRMNDLGRPGELRALSEGCASSYRFCILVLDDFLHEQRLDFCRKR